LPIPAHRLKLFALSVSALVLGVDPMADDSV